jgi:ABC-2 type transport system ATP-binding protein
VLEARFLSKRYNSLPAIEEVSFEIQPGQVLGCLGANGAGKSTTVKMLIGLLRPTTGQVLFRGADIHEDLAGYRKHIGYVPEEPNLYPYLSGREYLELVGTLRGMSRIQRDRKIADLLHLFNLYPHRDGALGSYSKGMRQRILLIAALMDNPSLLIFDEPLSGLDVISALVFKNLVRALGQSGKAVLYCSHVLEVVEKVCSHLLILRRGRIIAYESAAQLPKVRQEASLEETFAHLVDEVDAEEVCHNIIQVMGAA